MEAARSCRAARADRAQKIEGARPCLVARPNRAKSLVQACKATLLLRRRPVPDQSGPRSTTCPEFGLRSKPIRSDPILNRCTPMRAARQVVKTPGAKSQTKLDELHPLYLFA
uniref:Uncharacterized protein n=1 Tax=Opuntia streptacantha TaxID=393608 RepID=A0A7C9DWD6_OPUST